MRARSPGSAARHGGEGERSVAVVGLSCSRPSRDAVASLAWCCRSLGRARRPRASARGDGEEVCGEDGPPGLSWRGAAMRLNVSSVNPQLERATGAAVTFAASSLRRSRGAEGARQDSVVPASRCAVVRPVAFVSVTNCMDAHWSVKASDPVGGLTVHCSSVIMWSCREWCRSPLDWGSSFGA